MNLFELFFKIGAKDEASGVIQKLSAGFKGFAAIAGAAVGAAVAGMTAFATSSVKTGEEFDKAMSQVQATMLKTGEEFANEVGTAQLASGEFTGNLREFAQVLGETTQFSATQAAEALNYMALAGYNTQESMDMLPNVMALAAAGTMDLALASDMVTDTQTAFGITAQRTSQMVDEMAKAASTGNTSVTQLGDAFLTVGGLAKELTGGFVTLNDGTVKSVDGIQELEIALTAMANAGIKGSEAGTHMRNMLMKLSSPTSDGTKRLEELGVTVFDTDGKMRSLKDVMGDLNGALGNLTQQEKLNAISDLFNARDLAAAEALLGAVEQDWDGIGEAILDAEGAAQQMASIQLDNLSGDVTLFKSALEGAKIAISDVLTPTLREFVRFGTSGVSQLTQAFKEDGLSGAMSVFGDLLSEGVKMIVEKIPMIVDAAVELVLAFAGGIIDNIDTVLDAFSQIVTLLVQKAQENLPQIVTAVVETFSKIVLAIAQIIPEIVNAFVEVVPEIVNALVEQLPVMIDAYVQLLLAIMDAIPTVITTIAAQIPTIVNAIVNGLLVALPQLLEGAIQLFMAIVQAIPIIVGELVPMIPTIVDAVVSGLLENLPTLLDGAIQLFMAILDAIPVLLDMLLPMIPNIIETVVNGLMSMFPTLLQGAIKVFMAIVKAIPTIINSLIKNLPKIITTIITVLVENIPMLLDGAIQLFMAIIQALPTIIRALVVNLPRLITTIVNTLLQNLPVIITASVQLLMGIIEAIPQIVAELVKNTPQIISAIVDGLSAGLNSIFEVGANLLKGLWGGIESMVSWISQKATGFASGLVSKIKGAFGIKSPSKVFRDQIGKWLPLGLEEGFEKQLPSVERNLAKDINDMVDGLGVSAIDMSGNATLTRGRPALYNESAESRRPINLYIDKDTLVASTSEEMDRSLGSAQKLKARFGGALA